MYDGLYHSGVPGQKWGVKHGPPYPISRNDKGGPSRVVSTNSKKMTKETRSDHQKPVEKKFSLWLDKKRKKTILISTLSDDELRKRINRLELEKKYKELLKPTKKDNKTASEGKKFIYSILGELGKGAISAHFNKVNSSGSNSKSLSVEEMIDKAMRDKYINSEAERRVRERLEQEELDREYTPRHQGVDEQGNRVYTPRHRYRGR